MSPLHTEQESLKIVYILKKVKEQERAVSQI